MKHLKRINESAKNKEMLIKALNTLFYSWGGDTPEEVYWGACELLDWYESEFGVTLGIRFERDDSTCTNPGISDNFNEVIEAIRQS